ncbi:MAG: hypothetical protein QM674_19100 [Burkholderiaceae bacterium]
MDRFGHGWVSRALAFLLVLAACTPTFNWREVQAGDDGYRVMLPAKPSHLQRRINLDGLEVEMSMRAAEVEGMSFAVGAIRLPMGTLGVAPARGAAGGHSSDELAASLRGRALAAMRAQMVRNLRATERAAEPIEWLLVDGAGQLRGRVDGWQVEASGPGPGGKEAGASADGKAIEMIARFAGHGDRVWQAVVIGPSIDREQAKIFVESLRLIDGD